MEARTLTLREHIREAWHVIEPGRPLQWNWHIDAIAEHLDAVTRGEIKDLLISLPPGCMKSTIVSVLWPTHMWTRRPSLKFISCSYAMDLATRDSVKSRDIIQSSWFRQTYLPGWVLKGDQNVKTRYENTAGGGRQALSIGSMTTGFRADGWIVDDPLNASAVLEGKVDPLKACEVANKYIGGVLSTRLNDLRSGFRVVIMQRLHELDPIGFLLESGDFEHLCLPMEFASERRTVTGIGWTDPRKEEGQLLFPKMFPATELAKKKSPYELGSAGYEAQYQQDPTPSKGEIFDRDWFRYWHELPALSATVLSLDCTFKKKRTSDYVCLDAWGAFGLDRFLLEQIRERLSFTETLNAVLDMAGRFPNQCAVLVEGTANGPAILDALRRVVPNLIEVNPGPASKSARAYSVQPIAQGHCVYLPGHWTPKQIDDWLKEVTGFPKRAFDDRVDTMTQALNYMRRFSGVGTYEQTGSFVQDEKLWSFEVRV